MLLEAVIGVVGVFAVCRAGGELIFLGAWPPWSFCNLAILFTVGVLRGPTVSGGKFMDLKFFLGCCTGCAFFSGS